jgi:uracil-DNA glycosylase family 4
MDEYEPLRKVLQFYQLLGFNRLPYSLISTPDNKELISTGITPEVETMNELNNLSVDEALVRLREKIGDCTRCKLHGGRTNIVFGQGSDKSGLMFIGEAPGKEEDLQGLPFVGKAGELLTNLITKMGLKREDIYITNLVKSRPPRNRNPEPDEIAACKPFLLKEIDIIKPAVIITLGAVATKNLLEKNDSITALRGKVYDFRGAKVIPTFHPAYLLRNPKAKWLTWDDAQKALKLLAQS